MAKPKFYKVSTLPKQNANTGIFSKISKNRRRRQLIASVIGVYLLVGGMVGYILFNASGGPAKANESAFVTASIKLVDEREYKLGDPIKVSLTLQNTSITEPINSLAVDMFSTKDSVKWSTIQSQNKNDAPIDVTQSNSFKLPILSSGERIEYLIDGSLQDNQIDYLNVVGKIRYLNRDGVQEADTNRVFTKLNPIKNPGSSLLGLKPSKASYAQNEEVTLNLSRANDTQVSGKIYVVATTGQDVISTSDCELTDNNTCETKIKNLAVGSYTALFEDINEEVYSEIASFTVGGKKDAFVPATQANIEAGFSNASINGIVPVVAKRVVSLNQNPSPDNICNFEIVSGTTVVSTAPVAVEADRSCKTTLNSDNFKNGDGVYKIRLANSNLEKQIAYTGKSSSLITLVNDTLTLEKGKPVDVSAKNIVDSTNTPLDGKKVTLGLWHVNTGEFNEFTSFNGEALKVIAGNFKTQISATALDQGGLYLAYIKTEDSQQSDWLNLNFEDKQIAFSGSGVLFNSTAIRAGDAANFSLENITDRSGNVVQDGVCASNFYIGGNPTPLNISGQIKKGICTVSLPAGKLTKSGPVLVSFTGEQISSSINQSKQINVLPGLPAKYGQINLEYMPARKGYANNLIIGPITDKYGNLTNTNNTKLQIYQGEEIVQDYSPFLVQDGFAKIAIPGSLIDGDKVSFRFRNDKDEDLVAADVIPETNTDKLLVANLPSNLNNDKNITVGVTDLVVSDQDTCKLTWVKSQDEFSEQTAPYDSSQGKCNFDWALNQYRNTSQGLLKLQLGDKVFTSLVKLENGQASNLFVITPEVQVNPKNELNIALLTSPIVDKQGLAIEKSDLRWQYNGRLEQIAINKGFARLDLLASKLESKDIQTSSNFRSLDIDLDVKAGVTSISKTNNLNIYLDTLDVANSSPNFSVTRATNQIGEGQAQIFQFKSDICTTKLINSDQTTVAIKTHWQAGICYVQAEGKAGRNTLIFENKGFSVGSYTYRAVSEATDILWCTSESKKCVIQILAPVNSPIDGTIYDDDKQYKFTSENLENTLSLSQNGLNPLKKYKVEIKYVDNNNQEISSVREVAGEKFSQ